jgi:hypothetical protein
VLIKKISLGFKDPYDLYPVLSPKGFLNLVAEVIEEFKLKAHMVIRLPSSAIGNNSERNQIEKTSLIR